MMNAEKDKKYVRIIAWTLIGASAAFNFIIFILRYGVDVPYMDQWEYVGIFD